MLPALTVGRLDAKVRLQKWEKVGEIRCGPQARAANETAGCGRTEGVSRHFALVIGSEGTPVDACKASGGSCRFVRGKSHGDEASRRNSGITAMAALVLSIGIAIQNFPEGAIISMPLRANGLGRGKSFLYGFLSGVVEPVAAFVTILAAGIITPAMPYFLSFAAGAMIYVVVEELIPEMSQGRHSNIGVIAFAIGFGIMMMLDVALG